MPVRNGTPTEGLGSIVETWREDGRLVVTEEGYVWGKDIAAQYQCQNLDGILKGTHGPVLTANLLTSGRLRPE